MDSSDHQEPPSFIPNFFSENADTGIILYDAHCHLAFAKNPGALSAQAKALGIGALCCTVSPHEYLQIQIELAQYTNIQLALGLHPWWRGKEKRQFDCFLELLPKVRYVGEIGLDFSSKYKDFQDTQLSTFQTILTECALQGEKYLSIHCVRAYDDLIGMLASTDVTESCCCIIHSFNGTCDQLNALLKLGCCFSVGQRMLSTKRGRSYIQTIPENRLLIETDLPSIHLRGEDFSLVDFSIEAWHEQLHFNKNNILNLKRNFPTT